MNLEDMRRAARYKGLIWRGQYPPNQRSDKTQWKHVSCGHEFSASTNAAISKGCPVCYGKELVRAIESMQFERNYCEHR
jgi:hypothetical protein